jgi:hypothetical protein
MKNIHVLPTDKPSRLYQKENRFKLDTHPGIDWYISSASYKPVNIYITSDEEIKEDHYYYNERLNKVFQAIIKSGYNTVDKEFKIILTTDQDLIKDGVQAIDDEFLEWFVKNPSCEFVKVSKIYNSYGEIDIFDLVCTPHSFKYKIIIPKEELKQETLTYTEAVKKEERIFNSIMMKQETLEEAADAIETKYTNGKRNNFKYDIDWVKYILWTIICVCFGMVLGMFTTKLIYGL